MLSFMSRLLVYVLICCLILKELEYAPPGVGADKNRLVPSNTNHVERKRAESELVDDRSIDEICELIVEGDEVDPETLSAPESSSSSIRDLCKSWPERIIINQPFSPRTMTWEESCWSSKPWNMMPESVRAATEIPLRKGNWLLFSSVHTACNYADTHPDFFNGRKHLLLNQFDKSQAQVLMSDPIQDPSVYIQKRNDSEVVPVGETLGIACGTLRLTKRKDDIRFIHANVVGSIYYFPSLIEACLFSGEKIALRNVTIQEYNGLWPPTNSQRAYTHDEHPMLFGVNYVEVESIADCRVTVYGYTVEDYCQKPRRGSYEMYLTDPRTNWTNCASMCGHYQSYSHVVLPPLEKWNFIFYEEYKERIIITTWFSYRTLTWEAACDPQALWNTEDAAPEAPSLKNNFYVFSTVQAACKYAKINPLFYEGKEQYLLDTKEEPSGRIDRNPRWFAENMVNIIYVLKAEPKDVNVTPMKACAQWKRGNLTKTPFAHTAANVYYFRTIGEMCEYFHSSDTIKEAMKDHIVKLSKLAAFPREVIGQIKMPLNITLQEAAFLYPPRCEFSDFGLGPGKKEQLAMTLLMSTSAVEGTPIQQKLYDNNEDLIRNTATMVQAYTDFKSVESSRIVDAIKGIGKTLVHSDLDTVRKDDPEYVSREDVDEITREMTTKQQEELKKNIQELKNLMEKETKTVFAVLKDVEQRLSKKHRLSGYRKFYSKFIKLVQQQASEANNIIYKLQFTDSKLYETAHRQVCDQCRKQTAKKALHVFKVFITPGFDYNIVDAYVKVRDRKNYKEYIESLAKVNYILFYTAARCEVMVLNSEGADELTISDFEFIHKTLKAYSSK
ncbi:hypothetical protein QR680_011043 [Steinernema hermaphroditum]|uniref:Uncharacterized protein n=1 Tax=Steinernema hermaphroditum TaxID=289476 RepID=A0AA39IQW2_9BILA|nr:hypothetical protein QR680_011043 [Steinernema hermaphroditum]